MPPVRYADIYVCEKSYTYKTPLKMLVLWYCLLYNANNSRKGANMKHEIITRAEAFAQGRKHFYSGKPCKYGHDSARFTSTGGCMACNAARSKLFAQAVAASVFTYPLHPDDVAAALAYCQALDLQRGRMPTVPKTIAEVPAPRHAEPVALPADLERHRQTLVASYSQPVPPPYLPKP